MISCKEFFLDYNKKLNEVLKNHHYDEIEKITKSLEISIKTKKKVFVCGNGGSASIANHFLCDFNKGIKISSSKRVVPEIISLTNSIELITAIANDINYNEIFAFQLENYAKKNDVLIIISSSGKSKNIINAVKFAKKNQLKIISLIGFSDNQYLKKLSKHYINLNTKNYGITEDIFQSIMHMISQYLRKKYSKNNLEIF